jgi:hypothetical protein
MHFPFWIKKLKMGISSFQVKIFPQEGHFDLENKKSSFFSNLKATLFKNEPKKRPKIKNIISKKSEHT